MKKLFFLLFTLLFCTTVKADDYDVLYDRLYADYVAPTPLSATIIQGYMDSQQTNGSWIDIDYDQHTYIGGWAPLKHWERLSGMALALKKTSHTLYADTTLKAKIKAGLLYWYNRTPQPYSNNWYDNDIAKQDHINKILILVKNDFLGVDWDPVIKTGCDKYLSYPTNYHLRTLTNAVWIARNFVHHGVIEKDPIMLQVGINKMSAQLEIQPLNTEGVQKDYSYLVHELQVYNGGYGKSLIHTISYYMYLIRGLTLVGFSAGNVALLSDFLLNGDQWMTYGRAYDFSTVGRNLSRRSDQGISSSSLKSTLTRMQSIDPPKSLLYQKMYNHINSPTGAVTGLTGNKFFYRADYMTHRRENLFIGVKMCSSRTIGTEGLNSENILAYWLPFGATTIMRNTNEYYDVFGLWDWTKIPGVTNPALQVTWPSTTVYHTQPAAFVGGVSDGINGITAMNLEIDTIIGGVNVDIAAKKANFIWNNEMVCLGADINSLYSAAPTTTTINQSYLKTSVLVDNTVIPQEENTYPNAKWIHHDNTGYVFPSNTTVKMKTNMQTGNWYNINKNGTNEAISADVFKLWIDHGNAPSNASYGYVVLPNKNVSETSEYATNSPIVIHSNTDSIQAVSHVLLQQAGIVFYNAGSITIAPNLTITVDKPCVLLVDYSQPKAKVTISDPAQIQSTISVTMNYLGPDSDVINFTMPSGDLSGSSVSLMASKPRYEKGVWEKSSTSYVYNLGAGTGTGVIDGSGHTGIVATTSAHPSTQGFLPIPPSGKVKLFNKSTPEVGEGEWYLKNYSSDPALKFVSSRSGRVAKFSTYEIGNATQVASFFYKITFEQNSLMTEMDWQFGIGRTNGGTNQFNNENGIPASPSTTAFLDFFATVRWQLPIGSPINSNPTFKYCYKGSSVNGETNGTTYERLLNGITFTQGTTYNMEFYCNNSSEEQAYVRNTVSYTLPSNTMHIWANGIQLTATIGGSATANIPGYNLVRDANLDACLFVGQRTSVNGATKHAVSYIQDIQINHVQTPLSISLKSFNGTNNGSSVLLKWATASEQNNAEFNVFRKSVNSDFEVIGNVTGLGNSNEIKNYSFTDYNPLPGTNYYQLKQIDHEGKFSLSDIVALNSLSGNQELKIYINNEGELMASVFWGKDNTPSTFILTDISGKTFLSINKVLNEGANTISLGAKIMDRGVYVFSLKTPEGTLNTKFIH